MAQEFKTQVDYDPTISPEEKIRIRNQQMRQLNQMSDELGFDANDELEVNSHIVPLGKENIFEQAIHNFKKIFYSGARGSHFDLVRDTNNSIIGRKAVREYPIDLLNKNQELKDEFKPNTPNKRMFNPLMNNKGVNKTPSAAMYASVSGGKDSTMMAQLGIMVLRQNDDLYRQFNKAIKDKDWDKVKSIADELKVYDVYMQQISNLSDAEFDQAIKSKAIDIIPSIYHWYSDSISGNMSHYNKDQDLYINGSPMNGPKYIDDNGNKEEYVQLNQGWMSAYKVNHPDMSDDQILKKFHFNTNKFPDSNSIRRTYLGSFLDRIGGRFGIYSWDTESLSMETANTVERIWKMNKDIIELYWSCMPLGAQNGASSINNEWYPWSPDDFKIWCRNIPEWAMHPWHGQDSDYFYGLYSRNTAEGGFQKLFVRWVSESHRGPALSLVGVTFQESLIRRIITISSPASILGLEGIAYPNRAEDDYTTYSLYPITYFTVPEIWLATRKINFKIPVEDIQDKEQFDFLTQCAEYTDKEGIITE